MTGAQDPAALELLARHAEAIATVRDFAGRSGAERVVVLVDRGEEDPLMLEHAEDGTVEVTAEGRAAALAPATPLPAAGRPRGGHRGGPRRRARAGHTAAGRGPAAAGDPAGAAVGAAGQPGHGRAD